MVRLEEIDTEQESQFEWGKKGGVKEKDGVQLQLYESFTFNGVVYLLYDSVVFYHEGAPETDIGKLVEIYDGVGHGKKVRVVWFLRPIDVHHCLGEYRPRWNEIFLASGEGKGVSNINSLEAIVAKYNVVCMSLDRRNPQPSEEDFKMADYIFRRTFDVGKCEILKDFPDEIDGIKVKFFFNKRTDQEIRKNVFPLPKFQINVKDPTGQLNASSKLCLDKVMASPVKNTSSCRISPVVTESEKVVVRTGERGCASNETSRLKSVLKPSMDGSGTQSARISHGQDKDKCKVRFVVKQPMSASDTHPYKKMRFSDDVASTKKETSGKKPDLDRRSWFKQLSWGDKLLEAQRSGQLVLLDNLDPSYASSEVEALVWHAFHEKVEAKIIPHTTFSSPRYGKAFVIFKSKISAGQAISALQDKCLIQQNGRPVIGSRKSLNGLDKKVPDKASRFVGHICIERLRLQNQREEMRRAVSTSHCAQPNTIEYDMAMEWCLLLERSDESWKVLHQEQSKEIREILRDFNRTKSRV